MKSYLFLKSWPTAPLMILETEHNVRVVVVIRGLVVDIDKPNETAVYAKTDSGLVPMQDLRHVTSLDAPLINQTWTPDQYEIRDWDGRFRFNEVFGSTAN
jgi:hypothetical protein